MNNNKNIYFLNTVGMSRGYGDDLNFFKELFRKKSKECLHKNIHNPLTVNSEGKFELTTIAPRVVSSLNKHKNIS